MPQSLRDDSAMQFGGYGAPDCAHAQPCGDHPSEMPSCEHDDLAKLAQLYNPARATDNCEGALDGGRQPWGAVRHSGAESGPMHGTHALDAGILPMQQGAGGDSAGPEGMWSLASTDVQDLLMRFQNHRDIDVPDVAGGVPQHAADGCGSGEIGGDRSASATAPFLIPHGSAAAGQLVSGVDPCGDVSRPVSQLPAGAGTSDVDIASAPSAGQEDDMSRYLQAQT